ncbi:MAG: hypothetical protein V1723_00265 [Candidatus Uhrbacteria bacterium]
MKVTQVVLERDNGRRVPLGAGLREAADHPERFRGIRVDRYTLPAELAQNPYFNPGLEHIALGIGRKIGKQNPEA